MDLVTAIGLLSSFVGLEEAGRSWVLILKDIIDIRERYKVFKRKMI